MNDAGAVRGRSPAVVLAVVSASAFMGVLEVAIVNVALPSMQRDLGLSVSSLEWVVTAYSVTYGGFLLLGGRLADLLGRRRVFVTGLVLFSLSSLAFLPMSVSTIVSARVVGDRLIGRMGPRPILASGLALVGFGSVLLSRTHIHGSLADLAPAFILIGIGLGAAAVSVQVAAFMGVRPREAGLASGLVNTAQQLGGAVGVALIATLAASRARDALAGAGEGALAQARALAEGLEWGFLGVAAVAAAGTVLAVVLFGRAIGRSRD